MKDWESYWNTIAENELENRIFWNCGPERAASQDLLRFKSHMNADLPLLDLGCGSGKQTRFLAQHFKKVIGVDISPSAIQLAKLETPEKSKIEYRVLNAVNVEEAKALHHEFGEVNIYMRGVLHMIKRADRQKFITSLEILLGEKGILYQIELPTKAMYHLRSLPEDISSFIPRIVRRVGFNLEDRERYYPKDRWTIIEEGQNVTMNTIPLADGKEGALPANYLILKRKIDLYPRINSD